MKQHFKYISVSLFPVKHTRLYTYNMQSSSSLSTYNTTKLLVYIARVESDITERDIIDIIYNSKIGRVQYADLTAVRDNSSDAGPNPAIVHYSAFVMITNWDKSAMEDLNWFGQLKVWINSSRTSYWIIRHSAEGSEIPRSKVNTHQLAHYTAELYKRVESAEKTAEQQAKVIEDQNERISHMLEMMEKMLVKNEELSNALASTSMAVTYMDAFMSETFQRPPEKAEFGDNIQSVVGRLVNS